MATVAHPEPPAKACLGTDSLPNPSTLNTSEQLYKHLIQCSLTGCLVGQSWRALTSAPWWRSGSRSPPTPRPGRGGQEWRGELFVEPEKIFHALPVGVKCFGAIASLHGAVEFGMGAVQFARHGVGIVEVGHGAHASGREMRCASIENGLRFFFHSLALRGRRVWPWEIVVHDLS
jgi:hypothetical protein